MKVLIAGGAGFIGRHLCAKFLAHRWDVDVYDSMVTGDALDPAVNVVTDRILYTPANRWDLVIHAASPASPIAYWAHPEAVIDANARLTPLLVDVAARSHCRLLFLSSSEVYGNAWVVPQNEDYWGNVNPIGPRSHYDEGKRFSEAIIANAVRMGELQSHHTVIIRLFNVYGPGMRLDDGRAIPNFIAQALRGEPLTVHHPGTQTRSFTYVDDAIKGIYRAATCQLENLDIPHVFNIGNPEETEVIVAASHVATLFPGSAVEIVPGRQEEIQRRVPGISKAKYILQWQPEVPFAAGIRFTVAHYQSLKETATP